MALIALFVNTPSFAATFESIETGNVTQAIQSGTTRIVAAVLFSAFILKLFGVWLSNMKAVVLLEHEADVVDKVLAELDGDREAERAKVSNGAPIS
jgi:hypothetical protein